MTTILITGANGFTGRHACRHFLGQGMRVVAVVRRSGVQAEADEAITADLTDRRSITDMIERAAPDYVLHLAGRNAVRDSWEDPLATMETNVVSMLYLLDALRGTKKCRVLIVGSMLGYDSFHAPPASHPYGLSKTLQMVAAREWGRLFPDPAVLVARPSNLIGPGPSNGLCGLLARKAASIERGEERSPFRLSSWIEQRDYVDVRDAVAAYDFILRYGKPGGSYPVASGINRTIQEVADTIQSRLAFDLPLEVGDLPNYAPPSPVDSSAVRQLGWQPCISFERSIADAIDYFRQHPESKGR